MSNNQKQTHADYIKSKGKFTVDCNHVIFSSQEIELLETYGHWFEALTKGTLLPFNAKQQQFVEVARKQLAPTNDYERVWFKYLKRKEIEAKAGQVLHNTPIPNDDTFYNRDMAKDLKRSMFKMIKENHRK